MHKCAKLCLTCAQNFAHNSVNYPPSRRNHAPPPTNESDPQMVRIFHDKQSGEFVIQTTCLDADGFVADLSEALAAAVKAADDAPTCALGILMNAMPIAFKLSGYKADEVSEQRTLVCGRALPASADLVATAGR